MSSGEEREFRKGTWKNRYALLVQVDIMQVLSLQPVLSLTI